MRKYIFNILALLALVFIACNTNVSTETDNGLTKENNSIPIINYALVNTYPHDTTSFTEGLLINNGKLYESTGSPENMPQTKSLFGTFDTITGSIDTKVLLDRNKYFGEGITFLNEKVYQLTYQNKTGFIYDAKTFIKLGEFNIPGKEGWGLTTDSTYLIISDGTNILYYVDPIDFKTIKTIPVENEKGPGMKINELEYINNFIYGNVYETNSIIKIDPSSGKIVGLLNLVSLATEAKSRYPGSMEMNGIAYDPDSRKIYITGKMWPTLYKIQFPH